MNRLASYLQEHLLGEVLTAQAVRRYFSTDASVLEITPSMVVYPLGTSDVRKLVRFSWQLAERGHVLPITARGRGSDLSGAAIGKGIVVVFPAHMNQLIEIDAKHHEARVQPGINFRGFQDTMQSHGLFLPPYPASIDYSTIGGAIANNSGGEKSLKYGSMRRYVKSLEVVLANGELIRTSRLTKRELNRKKGLTTMEGDIYRQLDGLLLDNAELIETYGSNLQTTKNAAGYALADIKHKDGSFDLTPLLTGSQGTLGITTEATLALEPYTPETTLFAAFFSDLLAACDAVLALRKFEPSALEMVDRHLFETLHKSAPSWLHGLITDPYPAIALLIEFDDASSRQQHAKAKKTEKFLQHLGVTFMRAKDKTDRERLWAIRHSAAAVAAYSGEGARALPVIEDGIVPPERLQEFIEQIYTLLKKHHCEIALWGHAGDANLHMQPLLDLSKVSDRQKVFRLMDDYAELVHNLGGSTTAEHGDGRLRGPYLSKLFGKEISHLFEQVKQIFDPYGILNPGVKVGVSKADLVSLLRHECAITHLADHLPNL